MVTVSVSLSKGMLRGIENLVKDGIAANKADAIRKAVVKYSEDQAVEKVLRARRERPLKGNLDDLVRKIKRR